jgi:hypothetical protein
MCHLFSPLLLSQHLSVFQLQRCLTPFLPAPCPLRLSELFPRGIKNAPTACSTRARKESRWPWRCCAACNVKLRKGFALAHLLFRLYFILHVHRSNGAPSDRGCAPTCSVIKLSDTTERKSARNAMQGRRGQSWRWYSLIAYTFKHSNLNSPTKRERGGGGGSLESREGRTAFN